MTVERILAVKGHDVVTTQPHRTLQEVSHLLAEKGIGAVIVVDAESTILGILSERDVVRAIAQRGAGALDEAVSRFMTAKVATTTRASSIQGVMEQMTKGRFRHLPVVHHGHLEGVVSIGDLVKYRIAEIESEHEALRDYIAHA